jgi:hypothetical protein
MSTGQKEAPARSPIAFSSGSPVLALAGLPMTTVVVITLSASSEPSNRVDS